MTRPAHRARGEPCYPAARAVIRALLALPLASFLALAMPESRAQSPLYSQQPSDEFPPRTEPRPKLRLPELAFRLAATLHLPGPLAESTLRLCADQVEVEVPGGTARVRPAAEAEVQSAVAPTCTPPTPGDWREDAAGRRRFRAHPEGYLECQRRCRHCSSGWKRGYRLRVPGRVVSPPLVFEDRVFFGAMDNRVYAIEARNGHRLWLADTAGRVSWPLARFTLEAATDRDDPSASPVHDLVLVVPDHGRELIALAALDGERAGGVKFGEDEGKLVSGPLVVEDGRIVLAQQRYAAEDAALLVYRVEVLPDSRAPSKTSPSLSAPEAAPGRP